LKPLDILIINPGRVRHDYMTEHLGIASLKSFVSSRGYDADSLDMAVECLSVKQGVLRIVELQPTIIGISLLEDSKNKGLQLIRQLRKAGFQGSVIVGGYFATFASREILRDFPDIDFVVRGEGELTLLELLDVITGRTTGSLRDVKGLSFRDEDRIIENPARPLIQDLDMLPPVDRKYARMVLRNGSHLRIYGTRGCWGKCSFCDIIGMYKSSPGKAWRRRSVKKLVDEIEYLARTYKTDYFAFNDDQFLLRGKAGLERVKAFAAELKRRNLSINFELMCRADTVNRQTMTVLKEAGLKRVFIGLESFDDKQLQRFRKNISVRQNLKALIILYQLKIDVLASVILADAFTSLMDVVKQFVVLYELRRRYFNSPQCQISVNRRIEIYRGSTIYEEYRSGGILTRDHYLQGYSYRLKFLTGLRLTLFDLEIIISRMILWPVKTTITWFRGLRWGLGQLKLYLSYQK
jgi:anaerobic magnesium-protoporphyrin IX monomethyl ester cyclase